MLRRYLVNTRTSEHESRYYLSSLVPDADQLAKAVLGHRKPNAQVPECDLCR